MTHMPPDGGNFGRGGMEILDIAWFLLMLAAFAALVTFGVLHLRRTKAANSNPGRVLDMRLAKGEIDLATYNQIAARIGIPTKASAAPVAPSGFTPVAPEVAASCGPAPDATVTLGAPPAPASAPLTTPPAPTPEAGSIQPSTGTQPEEGTPETLTSPTGR